jgi:hypothetical protein
MQQQHHALQGTLWKHSTVFCTPAHPNATSIAAAAMHKHQRHA